MPWKKKHALKCFTVWLSGFAVFFLTTVLYFAHEFDGNLNRIQLKNVDNVQPKRALLYNSSLGQERGLQSFPHIERNGNSPDELKPAYHRRHFNPNNYVFTIENPHICKEKGVDVIIFVQSAVDHFSTRDKIRRTWASLRSYNGRQIRTVFMLGLPSANPVQQRLVQESTAHGDIVQMDFVDHYRNLTLKHIMALGWIGKHCSSSGRGALYVVKADDDTIVNVYKLVDFLRDEYAGGSKAITNHIYCSVYGNMSPRRERKDKWYVSKSEYPYAKYPPYCEGFAYVTGTAVTDALYAAASLVPTYWIDDVYVTGMLLQKVIGLGHRPFHKPYGYTLTNQRSCALEKVRETMFQLQKYAYNTIDWDSCWKNMTYAAKLSTKNNRVSFHGKRTAYRALHRRLN